MKPNVSEECFVKKTNRKMYNYTTECICHRDSSKQEHFKKAMNREQFEPQNVADEPQKAPRSKNSTSVIYTPRSKPYTGTSKSFSFV